MAYPTFLAATLSGASLRQLQYWREQKLLAPEYKRSGGRNLYSFRDVVALRTFVFLRESQSLHAIRSAVDGLRCLGEADHLAGYQLAVAGQDILWVQGDSLISLNHKPGQYRIAATMKDVLRTFVNMQGARVVDLQNPRRNLEVQPETQGGYPVILGTRIEYNRVSSLVEDGVPASNINVFYPSVSAAAARDATSFARLVSEFRRGRVPSAA